jgi:hypothetical protein
MQRICLMITVASLVLLAGDVLAGKPPASPVGEWSGQGKLKLKVKRGFKDRVSSSSGLNVTETNWTNVETAPVPGRERKDDAGGRARGLDRELRRE